jgi:hypothetical protein
VCRRRRQSVRILDEDSENRFYPVVVCWDSHRLLNQTIRSRFAML